MYRVLLFFSLLDKKMVISEIVLMLIRNWMYVLYRWVDVREERGREHVKVQARKGALRRGWTRSCRSLSCSLLGFGRPVAGFPSHGPNCARSCCRSCHWAGECKRVREGTWRVHA